MNADRQRNKELFQALASRGFKRNRSDTEAHCYTGMLSAAGRALNVEIRFRDLEFTRLPTLRLLHPEKEAQQVVAHLETSGALCFARNEDLVLDRYNVGGTVLMCLELARRGLERALTHKHLQEEIALEFPQHWDGHRFYYDIVRTENGHARLYSLPRESGAYLNFLTDQDSKLKRMVPRDVDHGLVFSSSVRAYVFHSEDHLTFTNGLRRPRTLKDFMEWLETTAPGWADQVVVQLSAEFPDGPIPLFVKAGNGCVGVSIPARIRILRGAQRKQGFEYIVRNNLDKIQVERHSGLRVDLPTIFRRNMNRNFPLTDQRLALIGCGTIGSHLAKFLVQNGAGHDEGRLLLIDNQSLEPGNVGRHYLGTADIGEGKADAMKRELLGKFAEANIQVTMAEATGVLPQLTGFDLIVDATGEEALSLSINHFFITRRNKGGHNPDLMYVRLFGNGAAAQVLLVDDPKFACFKCLKPDHDGQWRFNPLKQGTSVTQTVAACGEGQYIAYGVAAPVMAAALGLQLTLDWGDGSPAPRLRTLRIEKRETVEVKDKNPPRSERCPACANLQ